MAAQNNAIRTNYLKAKIDKTKKTKKQKPSVDYVVIETKQSII